MKQFLRILVAVSLVLAGASPACKFISGQTHEIEICTYDGIKTIKVAGEQAPENEDKHDKSHECDFCFAQTHLKLAKASPPQIIALTASSFNNPPSVKPDAQLIRHELAAISPRAPPFFQA